MACVVVPEFAVQALRRAEPELGGVAFGVTQGTVVIGVNAAAEALGLRVGLTVAQARAVAPEAVLKARSPELERAAAGALDDLGASFSPRVEVSAASVYIDVADLGRLFDNEAQIGAALHLGARKLGLDARIGIARDKVTARIAALAAEGVTVVPAGREPAFLARLPVGLLEASDELRDTFRRWGVRTIGELATLPAGGVALRLGAEGARLSQVARGEADAPLVPRPEPVMFEEGCDLEWPVENVEALLFALKRLVENLVERLQCRGLAAGDLELELKLDRSFLDPEARAGTGCEIRAVPVGAPTREPQTLLALLRLILETTPPPAPVTALVVRARADRTRAAQLGLFQPAGPSPDKLATLLARLGALVGAGRVGMPVVLDRHLPDAFAVQPFAPPPAEIDTENKDVRRLVLHAFRPPLDAEARLDRGRLRYLSAPGVGGQVIACAGPFRVRDGWWAQPVSRDYYDVELSDGAIYRVWHDLAGDLWRIEGCYE